jgi:hypothetical protein
VRRVIRPTTLGVLSFTLASCASAPGAVPVDIELTRIGEAVSVTENATTAQECEYVTEIAFQGTDENALRTLRNEAGRLGANLVLLVTDGTTVVRAEGYLCADQQ